MKKKLICAAAGACLAAALLGGAAASSGADTSLVSRDYLNGTFLQQVREEVGQWVQEALDSVYGQASSQLELTARGYLAQLGVPIPEGWTGSDSFEANSGRQGDILVLAEGSGLLWSSGSAVVSGELVDVTAGTQLPDGGALQTGHRYLAAGEVTVAVSSQSAGWSAEGIWRMGGGEEPLPFEDVPEGSWYYDAVRYVYEKGLYAGTSETEFSPAESMERGMITTVLHRLAGCPPVEYAHIFTDVPDGTWYTDGTIWAGQNEIVSGTGNQLFEPGEDVARQQIAAILYRYAQYVGADVSARGSLDAFSDADQVAAWAVDAVSWASACGIIQGDEGRILPNNGATRAEVAIMVQRFEQWLGA